MREPLYVYTIRPVDFMVDFVLDNMNDRRVMNERDNECAFQRCIIPGLQGGEEIRCKSERK